MTKYKIELVSKILICFLTMGIAQSVFASSCPDSTVERFRTLAAQSSGQINDDTQAYLQAAQYEMGVCACLSGELSGAANIAGLRGQAMIAKKNAQELKSGLNFRPWPSSCGSADKDVGSNFPSQAPGECSGRKEPPPRGFSGRLTGFICDGTYIPSREDCANPRTRYPVGSPGKLYCRRYQNGGVAGSSGMPTSGTGQPGPQKLSDLAIEYERRAAMSPEEAADQLRDDLIRVGMDDHAYGEARQALSMSDRARARAATLVADLEAMKISADTTDPRQLMQQYNSQFKRLRDMETVFINEVNQNMTQQVEKFANDLVSKNTEGALYGGLSMFGQAFENYEAKKALEAKKQQLLQQRDSQMRRAAEAMITLNEKNRLEWLERAAFTSEGADERYSLDWAEHFECFIDHINTKYTISNIYWSNNPCAVPKRSDGIPNNLLSADKKYARIAQRKFDTALRLAGSAPPEAVVMFLDAAIKFISAAIEHNPQEISHYYKLGKFSEWDSLTRFLAYSVVKERAPEMFLSPSEFEVAREKAENAVRLAVAKGDLDEIRKVLDIGLEYDLTIDGESVLLYAIRQDKPDIVQLLLNRYAETASENEITAKLTSTLVIASGLDKPAVVKRLIALGGDVDALYQGLSAVTAAANADAESALLLVIENSRDRERYERLYSNGPEAKFAYLKPKLTAAIVDKDDSLLKRIFFTSTDSAQQDIVEYLVEAGRIDLVTATTEMRDVARESQTLNDVFRKSIREAFTAYQPPLGYHYALIIESGLYALPPDLKFPGEATSTSEKVGLLSERMEKLELWFRNAADLTRNVADDTDKAIRFANWVSNLKARPDQVTSSQRLMINKEYLENVADDDEALKFRLARYTDTPISATEKFDGIITAIRELSAVHVEITGSPKPAPEGFASIQDYINTLLAQKNETLSIEEGRQLISSMYCGYADWLELPIDGTCLSAQDQEKAMGQQRLRSSNLAEIAVLQKNPALFSALAKQYDLSAVEGLKKFILQRPQIAPEFLVPEFRYTDAEFNKMVSEGHWGAVKTLLLRGVIRPEYTDAQGRNLLHIALDQFESNTRAAGNCDNPGSNSWSVTSRVTAAEYDLRYRELAASLIKMGVDPEARVNRSDASRKLSKMKSLGTVAECVAKSEDISKRKAKKQVESAWEQVLNTPPGRFAVSPSAVVDPWGEFGECAFLDKTESSAYQFGISSVHCLRNQPDIHDYFAQAASMAQQTLRPFGGSGAASMSTPSAGADVTTSVAGSGAPAAQAPRMAKCLESVDVTALGGLQNAQMVCGVIVEQGAYGPLPEAPAPPPQPAAQDPRMTQCLSTMDIGLMGGEASARGACQKFIDTGIYGPK